jgi:hypothetical protein
MKVNVKLRKEHEMVDLVYLLPLRTSNLVYFSFLYIKKYKYINCLNKRV